MRGGVRDSEIREFREFQHSKFRRSKDQKTSTNWLPLLQQIEHLFSNELITPFSTNRASNWSSLLQHIDCLFFTKLIIFLPSTSWRLLFCDLRTSSLALISMSIDQQAKGRSKSINKLKTNPNRLTSQRPIQTD